MKVYEIPSHALALHWKRHVVCRRPIASGAGDRSAGRRSSARRGTLALGRLFLWLGTFALLVLLMALLSSCTLSACQRRGVAGWRCQVELGTAALFDDGRP